MWQDEIWEKTQNRKDWVRTRFKVDQIEFPSKVRSGLGKRETKEGRITSGWGQLFRGTPGNWPLWFLKQGDTFVDLGGVRGDRKQDWEEKKWQRANSSPIMMMESRGGIGEGKKKGEHKRGV